VVYLFFFTKSFKNLLGANNCIIVLFSKHKQQTNRKGNGKRRKTLFFFDFFIFFIFDLRFNSPLVFESQRFFFI